MRNELIDLLTGYLAGWKSVADCADWLAGFPWDDPAIDRGSREIASRLELLATEVVEGLRAVTDFWQEASSIVSAETGRLYAAWPISPGGPSFSASSSDAVVDVTGITPWEQISQSWNISPRWVAV